MDNNPYRQTRFLLSAEDMRHFPDDSGREVAFVGKSNVGKSSIINKITGQDRLARTSKTPGRTQHINFFQIDETARLVDLPGYGYASVPESVKKQWGIVINDYFNYRRSLAGLILIIDIRRDLSVEDRKILDWCQAREVPVHLILNKSDKLPFGQRKRVLTSLAGETKDTRLTLQLFSALKGEGMDQLRGVLSSWLYPGKN